MGMNQHARITRSRYYAAREAEKRLTLARAQRQIALQDGDDEQVEECNATIKAAEAQINSPGPWGTLNANELQVLGIIALQANEGIGRGYTIDRPGGTWISHISVRSIMTMTGLARSTVAKVLGELHAGGYIEVVSGKEKGQTNEYRVVDMLAGAPVRPERLRRKTTHAAPSPAAAPDPGPTTDDVAVEAELVEDEPQGGYPFGGSGGGDADEEFAEIFGDDVTAGF